MDFLYYFITLLPLSHYEKKRKHQTGTIIELNFLVLKAFREFYADLYLVQ